MASLGAMRHMEPVAEEIQGHVGGDSLATLVGVIARGQSSVGRAQKVLDPVTAVLDYPLVLKAVYNG